MSLEVGSDMLLISDYFYASNIMSIEFETRHMGILQYLGLHNRIYLCNINNILATSAWFNIDIQVYSNDIKPQKPVTCRYWLPTHSACLLSLMLHRLQDTWTFQRQCRCIHPYNAHQKMGHMRWQRSPTWIRWIHDNAKRWYYKLWRTRKRRSQSKERRRITSYAVGRRDL